MFGEEEIVKAHTYLKEAEGEIPDAALLMGVSESHLREVIASSPVLSSIYGKSRKNIPYQPEQQASRSLPPAITQPPAIRMADAMIVQEEEIQRPLTKLGFNAREAKEILSIEEFAGNHFDRSLTMLHGGMVKTTLRLIFQAQEIEEKYLRDESLEQKDRDSWWDIYFRILENIRKQNDQAQKAALTRALIKGQKKSGPGKPGFTPGVAIQVNNPTSVNVTPQ